MFVQDTISPRWGRRRILHAQNKKSWHTILYLRDGSAKFDGVNKEHIEQALKDEEPEHDTRNYTRAARIGRKTRNKISTSLLNWIIKILGMS